MSRVTDLARAEADAVEAEEMDEAEEADALEGDDETEPEPSSNVSVERALKQLEAENERHAKRVAQIMGDDFELVHVCPGCVDFAAGFTLTPPDEAPPLLYGDEFQRCDKCNGYGSVLTHALTEHGSATTCRKCNGQGYIEVPLPSAAVPPPAAAMNPNHPLADQLRAAGYMVIDPPASAAS